MKKTLTVNLGGAVFHIDEDAYLLLDNYLCNLKLHFQKQDGAEEIVTDIEQRISELFLEKMVANSQVVTITDVEEVIERIGKPEEMEPSEEEEMKKDKSSNDTGKRRLYRNADDKMLGGVISGLSAYLGVEVTWFRLIVVFCAIFGFKLLVPLYVIFWIVVPEARTAAEKLSMRGEAVTVENIGKTVTDGFEKVANNVNSYIVSDKPRSLIQRVGDALLTIIGWFLKICLVVFAIVCSPLLFVLGVVFVALFFAAIVVAFSGGGELLSMLPMDHLAVPSSPLVSIVIGIAGILFVGIPLVSIVFAIFRMSFNWKPMVSGLKWTLFLLWIVSVVLLLICYCIQVPSLPIFLQHI